jgi:hypothetical protein
MLRNWSKLPTRNSCVADTMAQSLKFGLLVPLSVFHIILFVTVIVSDLLYQVIVSWYRTDPLIVALIV